MTSHTLLSRRDFMDWETEQDCIAKMREHYGDVAVYWFCRLQAYKYRNSLDEDKAVWYENYANRLSFEAEYGSADNYIS